MNVRITQELTDELEKFGKWGKISPEQWYWERYLAGLSDEDNIALVEALDDMAYDFLDKLKMDKVAWTLELYQKQKAKPTCPD
jgi:hypothetical protein